MINRNEFSSFRDPSGFIFYHENEVYRAVNHFYKEQYDLLISSGLYDKLVSEKYLIPHTEVENINPDLHYKILKPQKITFISYPYEWGFNQFKDAALLTLDICLLALDKGMVLKDASYYNVQFLEGKPIFIDTLSFEKYENKGWVALRQFCENFLGPLMLVACGKEWVSGALKSNMNGIPVSVTWNNLPFLQKINIFNFLYFGLPSTQQFSNSKKVIKKDSSVNISAGSFRNILLNIRSKVLKLAPSKTKSHWLDYYETNTYNEQANVSKKNLVEKLILDVKPKTVWDFGANLGVFSELASRHCNHVVSFELDEKVTDELYKRLKNEKETKILPLVFDIANPSPGIGVLNKERRNIFERGNSDLSLALALIHHNFFNNNIPFRLQAEFYSRVTVNLIIEWIPENDEMVLKLKGTKINRENYSMEEFLAGFSIFFDIVSKHNLEGSERIIYLMKNKNTIKDEYKN